MMCIRRALQRWIEDHPEIVGTDPMVITAEFNDWGCGLIGRDDLTSRR